MFGKIGTSGVAALFLCATFASAQEPAAWGTGPEATFHTFSIVAVDPRTGETGVVVTTRNPCVGNAVPWVRGGVGAVATQGGTRVEYGTDLLDRLERGMSPQAALDEVVAADEGRERRQVGVIDIKGRSAQWTGKGDTFQSTEGSVRTRRDVLQLKVMLHALGYYRPDEKETPISGQDALLYTPEAVAALDRFRADQEWGTTVPGYVDQRVIDRLWSRLEEKGLADSVRRTLLDLQRLR